MAQKLVIDVNNFKNIASSMTHQEFSCYMILIFNDWEYGSIPHDTNMLAKLCRMTPDEFAPIWDRLEDFCVQHGEFALRVKVLNMSRKLDLRIFNGSEMGRKAKKAMLEETIGAIKAMPVTSLIQEKTLVEMTNEKSGANKKFIPPTLKDVRDLARVDNVAAIEADAFWNFYEMKAWMVGKLKMKQWKNAWAGWVLRKRKEQNVIEETAKPQAKPISPGQKIMLIQQQIELKRERLEKVKRKIENGWDSLLLSEAKKVLITEIRALKSQLENFHA